MGKKTVSVESEIDESLESIVSGSDVNDSGVHGKIKSLLQGDHLSYVLVTCKKTSEKGNMEVVMSYTGDPVLASYLVEGTLDRLEQDALICEDALE